MEVPDIQICMEVPAMHFQTLPVSGQDWSDGDNTCVICMEPMVRVARSIQPSDPARCLNGEAVEVTTGVRLPCRHYFHRMCIAKWWSTQASSPSADVSCPTCNFVVRLREQLEQEEEEEEMVETAEEEPQQPGCPSRWEVPSSVLHHGAPSRSTTGRSSSDTNSARKVPRPQHHA